MRGSYSWLLDVPELYKRRAPGNTCLSALKYGQTVGPDNDFIKAHCNDSKGCGGVMRVAPLALNYPEMDIETIDYEGAQIAAITHGHSLGYMLIDLAVELSENSDTDLNNIHRLGEGWVAEETLAISIYCALRYQDDFSAGIIASVNHKGDSDSTGAVTGNIIGALLGYDAIDDKWKKDLELHDVIIEMADDLCHGCQMDEYSEYEDPDWFRKYIGMRWKEDSPVNEDSEMDIEDFIQSPGFYEMNKALRNGELF